VSAQTLQDHATFPPPTGYPDRAPSTFVTHALEQPSKRASSALFRNCAASSVAFSRAASSSFLTYLTFLTFGAGGTEVTRGPALAGGPWRSRSAWLRPQGSGSHQDYVCGNGKATR